MQSFLGTTTSHHWDMAIEISMPKSTFSGDKIKLIPQFEAQGSTFWIWLNAKKWKYLKPYWIYCIPAALFFGLFWTYQQKKIPNDQPVGDPILGPSAPQHHLPVVGALACGDGDTANALPHRYLESKCAINSKHTWREEINVPPACKGLCLLGSI